MFWSKVTLVVRVRQCDKRFLRFHSLWSFPPFESAAAAALVSHAGNKIKTKRRLDAYQFKDQAEMVSRPVPAECFCSLEEAILLAVIEQQRDWLTCNDFMSEQCFFSCFLSEQGAFVPETKGRTKEKKKGKVLVVFFLVLWGIMSDKTTAAELKFIPEESLNHVFEARHSLWSHTTVSLYMCSVCCNTCVCLPAECQPLLDGPEIGQCGRQKICS